MRTLAVLSTFLLLPSFLHAEGVGDWQSLPSGAARVRAVQTLYPSSLGIFTLGGSALRYLPAGKSKWEVLHQVKGGNLYRIAVDDGGRVLASWEGEKVFHLFTPKTKGHKTFLKPARPKEWSGYFSLDGVHFSKDGRDAIVYTQGGSGSGNWTVAAHRYRLDGKSGPDLLFQQAGYKLYTSGRAAVFAVPKDPKASCNHNGCWPIASILAYDLTPSGVVKRTLLSGERDNLSSIRGVGSTGEEGLSFVVTEKPEARGLLSWRFGEARAEYRNLSKGPAGDPEKVWRTKSGEFVEFWRTGEEYETGLEVRRRSPGGGVKKIALDPMPMGDIDAGPDSKIHSVRERKNGDLLLHWGDHLLLLSPGKAPRSMTIEPLLGRLDEWAGVGIYTADPEALWIGVEVGAGRDFVRLGMDEFEKRAKPLR